MNDMNNYYINPESYEDSVENNIYFSGNNEGNRDNNKLKRLIILFVLILIIIGSAFLVKTVVIDKNLIGKNSNSVDKIAPSLMDVSIYSNNKNNKYYAEIGDTIYLTFKSDEMLASIPDVEINGTKVKVSKKEDYYIAVYDVVEQFTNDLAVSFKINNYSDKAGNKGADIYNTNDQSWVVIIALNKDVSRVHVSSISLNKQDIYLTVGDSEKLEVVVTPPNAVYENVIWQSNDGSVVSVENGLIKANKTGHAIVTAIVEDKNVSTNVWVVEKNVEPTSLKINNTNKNMYVGDSLQLNVTINPYNATNTNIKWSSSDNSVASVSNGVVVAKNIGKVTITAKLGDLKSTIDLAVEKKNISVSYVSLSNTNATLYVGNSIKLVASVQPYNVTNKTVTWKSSNTSVATVSSSGVVTGKGAGSATITATAGGKSATATITVLKPVTTVAVSSVSLNRTSASINVGSSVTLVATVNPSNATNKAVTWNSSNTSVATVSSSGVVTGKAPGTATITVTTNSGSKKATATITVIQPVTGVALNKTSETKYLNASSTTVSLVATVSPSNASNKSVTWSSSNTNVATVSSSGVVTAKNPGVATITVKTANGGKTDTFNITVKKKVVIVIGASQVKRMYDNVSSYTSTARNYTYTKNAKTLNFIHNSGTGFAYQVGNGWTSASNIITGYSSAKSYVEFYVFFPMAGNDIKSFTCNSDYPNHAKYISSSNSYITGYAANYNNVIKNIKNSGYNINAYVVSSHPVVYSQRTGDYTDTVVTNNDSSACKVGYRSNEKYYEFNKAMKSVVTGSYSTHLKYQSLFKQIMTTNENGTNFSFNVTYNTTDGVHWNPATTRYYVDLMLNDTGVL